MNKFDTINFREKAQAIQSEIMGLSAENVSDEKLAELESRANQLLADYIKIN